MLIFEKSRAGRGCTLFPPCDVEPAAVPEKDKRELELHLPELSETEISRHYGACEEGPRRKRRLLSARLLHDEV